MSVPRRGNFRSTHTGQGESEGYGSGPVQHWQSLEAQTIYAGRQ